MSKFDLWLIVGLLGQLLFSLRFLVQWLASEKKGKSTVVSYKEIERYGIDRKNSPLK